MAFPIIPLALFAGGALLLAGSKPSPSRNRLPDLDDEDEGEGGGLPDRESSSSDPEDLPEEEEQYSEAEENFLDCIEKLLPLWRPYDADSFHLPPEVAANLDLIMESHQKQATAPYKTVQAMADFGMVHVLPECDWFMLRNYVRGGGEFFDVTPEELDKIDEIYESVEGIAREVLEDFGGAEEPDFDPSPEEQDETPSGGSQDQMTCPPGYFYDALHDVCCPDGFYWDTEDQTCRPMGHSERREQRKSGYAGGG